MKWSDEAVEASRLALLRCSFGESIPTNPQMRAALEAASAVAEKEHGNLRAEVERLTRELKHEVATWKSLQEGSAAIIDGLRKTLAQARRDENEACAQIAEKLEVQDDFGFWSRPTPAEIAAAIRARIAEPRDGNRTA